MTKLLCCLFTFFVCSLNAQILEGTLKDSITGEPLSYVNIGVVGKNIGTVSEENGKFQLLVPEANNSDILKISMIGYQDSKYAVSEFRKLLMQNGDIKLIPSNTQLQEVVISHKKLKEKILGNKTESKSMTAGFTSNTLGYEMGIVIKIKKSPTFIKSFSASVASKRPEPVKLRLNFYTLKDGLPDKIIQDKNIIVTVPVVDGKITVDLQEYDIVVNDDFFVGLEWIESSAGQIMFSAGLWNSPIISRGTSQGNWEKFGMVGIGFTVKTAY